MQVQLALDFIELPAALALVQELLPAIHVVEVGTPWIIREGMAPVRALRAAFPALALLADLKIMDAGAAEAEIALTAGATLVTVLGVADDATVAGAAARCRALGGRAVVDMMAVADPVGRAQAVAGLGAHAVCLHTATDRLETGHPAPTPDQMPAATIARIRELDLPLQIAVAGGISPATLPAIASAAPDTVVIGRYLTQATDPRAALQALAPMLAGTRP